VSLLGDYSLESLAGKAFKKIYGISTEEAVNKAKSGVSEAIRSNVPLRNPLPTGPSQNVEIPESLLDRDRAEKKLGNVGKTTPLKRPTTKLRYPRDTKDTNRDYLEIRAIEYRRKPGSLTVDPGFRTNSTGEKVSTTNKKILSVIQLPIPSNIQDGNSTSFESSNLNGFAAAAAAGSKELMNLDMRQLGSAKGRDALQKELTGIFNKSLGDIGGINIGADLINKILISQAVGALGGNVSVDQLLAREQGVIFNPNMELLFNGPTLRQFRFSFKLTPRDGDEAEEIRQIIREFKQSMAPKITTQGSRNNLFLKTPDVFELYYMTGNSQHKFLHRFKECALTDMSVNYTGEGTYATYAKGVPISMIMDLTFKELEPIYDIDYNDGIGGVGY